MTIDTAARSRVPEGVPSGGQFATETKAEAPVALTPAPEYRGSDAQAVNQMAAMIGGGEDWRGSGDYLEDIANIIARTGRPHPGDVDNMDAYRAQLLAHQTAHPRTPDGHVLDRIAIQLASTEHWGADDVGEIANKIQRTGRPSWDEIDPDNYSDALHRWSLAQGLYPRTAEDDNADVDVHVRAQAEQAGLGSMGTVLPWTRGQEGVTNEHLTALDGDAVTALYDEHVGPVVDRLPEFLLQTGLARKRLGDKGREWAHETIADVAEDHPVVRELLLIAHEREDGLDRLDVDDLDSNAIETIERALAAPMVAAIARDVAARSSGSGTTPAERVGDQVAPDGSCPGCGGELHGSATECDWCADGYQSCSKCQEHVHTLSSRYWCDGCEEDASRS